MTARIYLARPIDGRSQTSIYEILDRAEREFQRPRFEIVDPVAKYDLRDRNDHVYVVATELEILRSCNIILIDMSLANHTYIGCVAELIYAHLWNLITVVYVGSNSALTQRPWLRFHADHIDTTWKGAVEWIHTKYP